MISILMPIYNRENLIIETLNSIVNQTFHDWECIIVDDGSTDNTKKVVSQYIENDTRFKFLSRPENAKKGPSSCRNYAFEIAKGDYIQFFDSDDIMHKNHLLEKRNVITENDAVICKLKLFNNAFDENLFDYSDNDDLITSTSIFDDFVTGKFEMMMVAPLWKKKFIQNYMPINNTMHMLEDHDLHARALFANPKLAIINDYLIYYRKGHDALTTTFFKNISSGLDSYLQAKQTVLNLKNTPKIKLNILKQVLGYFRLGLAARQFQEAKKCLIFIDSNNLAFSRNLKLKLIRIKFLFQLIKVFKGGDFFLKPFLKV
jgi:glycosyltransferase involved in cell wall biosynthesis